MRGFLFITFFGLTISLVMPSRTDSPSNQDNNGEAARSARDYYKELYAAGGLDRLADLYACFEDDPKAEAFFIFGKGKDIREFMVADGTFDKLPKSVQQLLKKDPLIVRGYDKGVPWKDAMWLDKDQASWISDERKLKKNTLVRVRFTINWQTLRYKWAAEALNMDQTYRSEVASFGKCEEVPTGVHQHGNEDR